MRSVGKFLLAVALVGCVASSANAANFVWAQLGAGSSPGVVGAGGGVEGSTLLIDKPLEGSYTVNVEIWVRNDAAVATTGLTGYRSVFIKDPVDTEMSLASAISDNPQAWTGTSNPGVGINTGSVLIDIIGHSRTGSQAPINVASGAKKVYSLSLTVNKTGAHLIHNVWMAVAVGTWASSPPTGTNLNVSFGPNGPISGSAVANIVDTEAERTAVRAGFPMISIRNVPEPATIGLLALGMLGLIRRRS